ncbi:MAG: hypothetical protein QW286_02475 [Candidatus Aenigmatarchaeota archaeon]
MNQSLRSGFSFGLTSGIITTLGLMVGLHSGTHSKTAVIGGILVIALADAFSDALGMHISEESENEHTTREIWESTLSTLFAKFFFAMKFAFPVLLLPLYEAIITSVLWGMLLLLTLSVYIARSQKKSTLKVASEHIVIALLVLAGAHYIGDVVASIS